MKLLSKIFIIIVMIFSLISPRIVFASEEKTYGKVYYLDSHISRMMVMDSVKRMLLIV